MGHVAGLFPRLLAPAIQNDKGGYPVPSMLVGLQKISLLGVAMSSQKQKLM
jgi:hypothetical protein